MLFWVNRTNHVWNLETPTTRTIGCVSQQKSRGISRGHNQQRPVNQQWHVKGPYPTLVGIIYVLNVSSYPGIAWYSHVWTNTQVELSASVSIRVSSDIWGMLMCNSCAGTPNCHLYILNPHLDVTRSAPDRWLFFIWGWLCWLVEWGNINVYQTNQLTQLIWTK